VAQRGGRFAGRPWLRAWLVTGLAAWTTLGVLLVTRANNFGLVDDISISPYHVVGYAALLTLAAYVAWTFFRGLRRGTWRDSFPPLYGGLGLGFLALLLWVVLDPIWRDTLGIRLGIEGGLAPTRLLIPMGLALLAVGPLREAIALRAERGLRSGERFIRWAGVVAAGLVGSALTLAAFNPIQTPTNDWSFQPAQDNSEIWTMRADGSEQTRLLPALGDGVDYSLPAWSPDGSRIAYTVWTNEDGALTNTRPEDQSSSIWTMAADGTDRRLLVDGGEDQAWIPNWSHDGQWISYTLTPLEIGTAAPAGPQANQAPGPVGAPSGIGGATLWIVRPDGTDARQVSEDGITAFGGAWAPDGLRLAYLAAAPGAQADIRVAPIDVGPGDQSGLLPRVVVASHPADDWGVAWSPDGQELAFTSNRSGNEEIWAVDPRQEGAAPRQLTDDGAGDWVPAYYPDGSRIAFVSDRTGEPEIWSMARDGTDLRNLTNHPQHFDGNWSLSWSPDGSTLAYGNASFQGPVSSGWVREDFAAAQALLFGLALAILALLVVALGAPLGSFAVVLTIVAVAAAIPGDRYGFIPGAAIAGLIVDGVVGAVGPRWKARTAAAALPVAANLAIGLTIGIAGTLAWSITLLLGVALASGILGWALAEVVERLLPRLAGPEPAPIEG
jgi:Tol biopolymer transport system component